MGEALDMLVEEAQGLASEMDPHVVFSIGGWDVTQYVIWLFIATIVTLVVVIVSAKKLRMVPSSRLSNTVEYGYDLVSKTIAQDVIGEGFKKHVPFLATLFFFILVCNVLGLVPGFKTATGTISCTWALAAISFVYFIVCGIKANGVGGYLKSLCPHGLPIFMVPIVWTIELISTLVRVLTLAVRLYGNMFAGHIMLAVFGVAATCFVQAALFSGSMNLLVALPSVAWVALLFAMYVLECLVALIQAFVFATLSASYIGGALHPH